MTKKLQKPQPKEKPLKVETKVFTSDKSSKKSDGKGWKKDHDVVPQAKRDLILLQPGLSAILQLNRRKGLMIKNNLRLTIARLIPCFSFAFRHLFTSPRPLPPGPLEVEDLVSGKCEKELKIQLQPPTIL